MNSKLHQEYKPRYEVDVLYFGKYYKRSLERNDPFSAFILDLKRGEIKAVDKAAELLNNVMPEHANVCVVPASKKGGRNNMLEALQRIKDIKGLQIYSIKRIKDVGKKATGEGSRDYSEEKESISCGDPQTIKDKHFFLIDDITTSGVSFAASRDLLKESGALSITCLALGNTVNISDLYDETIIGLLQVKGLGRKYASEILDTVDRYHLEGREIIYKRLLDYSKKRRSIFVPEFNQFCKYIDNAASILKHQEEQGIISINKYSNNYPAKFKDILAPPVIIFVKGNLSLLHGYNHIAVVGSRNATDYGCRIAYRLGEVFAQNSNIVVSGLAKGCDTYGHRGCIDAKGKTVAILPSPVDAPEPKENREFAKDIVNSSGLLLSEYYEGQKVQRGYYVARDRLQSALSDAVVVVETETEGGTMHTVEYCRDQNRLLACSRHPDRFMNLKQLGGNKVLLETDAIPIGNKDELSFFFKQLSAKREELKKTVQRQEQISLFE